MKRFNYFREIELKYKYQLSKKKPIVVRLDGRNITKNTMYNLSTKNAFTTSASLSAKMILKNFNNCKAFIIGDEINFIFEDATEFFKHYVNQGNSLQYCLSIFLQDFLNRFWSMLPDTFFGASIFNIPCDKIESYIKYRKSAGYNVAVFYYAKRNLLKNEYSGKTRTEVESIIKKKGKWNDFVSFKPFTEGILHQ